MRPHAITTRVLLISAISLKSVLAPESAAQELPPEMQVDRLLVQAGREIEDGEPWSAVVTFERILDLSEEHGLEIPAEFWFRQAGVLQGAGLHKRAKEASTRYLQEAGREGEHYRAALQVLDAAEVGLAQARRAEARARAAVERAQREATARVRAEARAYADFRSVLLAESHGQVTVFSDELAAGGEGPVMVVVPGGTFDMGCDRRRDIRPSIKREYRSCRKQRRDASLPRHRVQVASFAISRMPVTHAEWNLCVRSGGCERGETLVSWNENFNYPVEGANAVYLVHRWWDQTQEYVAWLSRETGETYRLPTEAEWEYAIRAGEKTSYDVEPQLYLRGESVGSLATNSFGLYRLVYEWVHDCWSPSYVGAPEDGSAWMRGDCRLRVVRTGAAGRYGNDAFNRGDGISDQNTFRVVRAKTR